MNSNLHDQPSPAAPSLDILGKRLRDARAAVDRHRQGPVGTTHIVGARQRLLGAMEEYIAALEARGLPVPYQLRDELRLARTTGLSR
ncbi:MAG: hypothetical protein ACRDPI_02795 [Nocardioidaceae bacterium]